MESRPLDRNGRRDRGVRGMEEQMKRLAIGFAVGFVVGSALAGIRLIGDEEEATGRGAPVGLRPAKPNRIDARGAEAMAEAFRTDGYVERVKSPDELERAFRRVSS